MSGDSSYLRRGGAALVAIGIGGFVADYALNVGLSRTLDAHAYGDFRVARAFALFFGSAVLLGGDRAAPKALAGPLARGEPAAVWEYVRFYLRLSLALSLLVVLTTWGVGLLHVGTADVRHHHALAWMVVSVPVVAAGAMVSRTLQSALFPVDAALPWRVGLPALLLGGLAVLSRTRTTVGLTDVVVLAIAATGVVAGWQWRRARQLTLRELRRDSALATPRSWLRASIPMMGFFLVALALNQSDLYFLEILGEEHEVGLYAAAETTAHVLVLLQTTVVALVAPLVQTSIEAGGEAPRRTRRRGEALLVVWLVPAASALALAARPVLSLFGSAYVEATTELRWLLAGNLSWAAAALAGLWLQYTDRGRVVVILGLATLLLDSMLNAALIPTYGMRGAAASTALTMTLAACAIVVAARRPAPARRRPASRG